MARHRCDSIRSRCAAGSSIAGISKGTSTTKFSVASVIDFVCYFAERHRHGMAVFDQVKVKCVCVYVYACVCMVMCVPSCINGDSALTGGSKYKSDHDSCLI